MITLMVKPKEYDIRNNKECRRIEFYQKNKLIAIMHYEEAGLKKIEEYNIDEILSRPYFRVDALENPKEWSRKRFQNRKKKEIKEGGRYEAQIMNPSKTGLFCTIMDDVEVYVNCTQTSRCYNHPQLFFTRGEKIDIIVKEREMDEDGNCWLHASRRDADQSTEIEVGDLFLARIATQVEGGYYCELTPNKQGVVDTMEELNEGDEMLVIVKRITENGYIHLVPYRY